MSESRETIQTLTEELVERMATVRKAMFGDIAIELVPLDEEEDEETIERLAYTKYKTQ